MTIFVYAVIAWACCAAISAATDMYLMYRSLSGRDGTEVLALTREHAARVGGVQRWVMTSLADDILVPWLIWYAIVAAHRLRRS